MKYLLLAAAVICLGLGQILLKKGVMETSIELTVNSIIRALFTPYIFFGYFFYGAASIIGLFLLKQLPVSIAFPAMSLTYIVVIIAAAVLFQEKLTIYKGVGVAFIMLGVSFLFRV